MTQVSQMPGMESVKSAQSAVLKISGRALRPFVMPLQSCLDKG
jgi:hypothetical protein